MGVLTMSRGVTKFEIEKFDGNNFALWKMKVEDLLVQNNQVLALKGTTSKPASMKDEEWGKLHRKAVSTIHLFLADPVLFNVAEEKTVKELWENLKKLYETKTTTNKVFLKKQLYALKMKEVSTVADHLNVFDTLFTLLCPLSNSWDHFVMTINNPSSGTPNIDDVVVILLGEELRWKSSLDPLPMKP